MSPLAGSQDVEAENALQHMLPQLFALAASSDMRKKRLGLRGLHHLVLVANSAVLNKHREMLTEALLQQVIFREAELLGLSVPAAARLVTRVHRLHGAPNSSRPARQALESKWTRRPQASRAPARNNRPTFS